MVSLLKNSFVENINNDAFFKDCINRIQILSKLIFKWKDIKLNLVKIQIKFPLYIQVSSESSLNSSINSSEDFFF